MALWQVILIAILVVIAALIGAILTYARILTNRIGSTNATLKRIEEALLATDPLRKHAPAATAQAAQSTEATEAPQSPQASVSADASVSHEVSVKEGGAGYLTIRDLKVMASAVRADGEGAVAMESGNCDSLDTSGDAPRKTDPLPIPASAVSPDTPNTSGEQHGSPDSGAVSGDPVTVSPESGDVSNTSGELQTPPDSGAESADLIETKNRDALLMLNNQRRRRRARAGY